MDQGKKPLALKALIAMVMFLGLAGIPSGLLLMLKPDGSLLGLPSDMLQKLPVGDWFLVGLFLFVAYGLCSWILVYGLWTRQRWTWTAPIERLFRHHWSWAASIVMGAILIVWTGIELALWGFLGLSVVFIVFAVGILTFSSLRPARTALAAKTSTG